MPRLPSAAQQFRLKVAFSLLFPIVAVEPSSAARDTADGTLAIPKDYTVVAPERPDTVRVLRELR